MSDLEHAKAYFSGDLFATECAGVELTEVRPGYAKGIMPVTAKVCNARGVPMGGAIFTLADLVFAASVNYAEETVVTQSANITFLTSAKGDTLIAEATEVRRGKRTTYCNIEVKDSAGRLIAAMTVSGFIL